MGSQVDVGRKNRTPIQGRATTRATVETSFVKAETLSERRDSLTHNREKFILILVFAMFFIQKLGHELVHRVEGLVSSKIMIWAILMCRAWEKQWCASTIACTLGKKREIRESTKRGRPPVMLSRGHSARAVGVRDSSHGLRQRVVVRKETIRITPAAEAATEATHCCCSDSWLQWSWS